jgi:predicted DNA-binding transcriptional regulator AlpA
MSNYRRPDHSEHRTILSYKECTAKTGFKPRQLKKMELAGEFPQRVTDYDGCVGWYADEVEEALWKWLRGRTVGFTVYIGDSQD